MDKALFYAFAFVCWFGPYALEQQGLRIPRDAIVAPEVALAIRIFGVCFFFLMITLVAARRVKAGAFHRTVGLVPVLIVHNVLFVVCVSVPFILSGDNAMALLGIDHRDLFVAALIGIVVWMVGTAIGGALIGRYYARRTPVDA